MSEYTFISKDRVVKFIIPVEMYESLCLKVRTALPNETGGILCGHYSADLNTAKVSRVIGNTKDSGRGTSFLRDGKFITKELAKLWKDSGGKEYYIGDWHSHPYSNPMPSQRDEQNMIEIANENAEQCHTPILLIIGNEMRSSHSDVTVHAYYKDRTIRLFDETLR